MLQGKYTIKGSRVSVNYENGGGFETWTIIDHETFRDDNFGNTWLWVRNL
jgi:hypothetical protein